MSVEGRFATVFENAGASYFRGLVAEAERHGPIDCRPLDGHWNHRGHEVIGRLLQSRLFASKSGASARKERVAARARRTSRRPSYQPPFAGPPPRFIAVGSVAQRALSPILERLTGSRPDDLRARLPAGSGSRVGCRR